MRCAFYAYIVFGAKNKFATPACCTLNSSMPETEVHAPLLPLLAPAKSPVCNYFSAKRRAGQQQNGKWQAVAARRLVKGEGTVGPHLKQRSVGLIFWPFLEMLGVFLTFKH